jgi:predicted nucleic acid-binding protein
MILVDTSIWIDHLRRGDPVLVGLLQAGQILTHPFIIGELALGSLRQRDEIVGLLQGLPKAVVASHNEVLHLIQHQPLSGCGIGYVDTHLLAATRLTPHAALWTRDKRLLAIAERLQLSASATNH